MKNKNILFAAVILSLCSCTGAFAKTAKECTAEWRADKTGMQARGTTEKSYVEQCKGGAELNPTPSVTPAAGTPPASPRQVTPTGSKTAKDCTAEWRADKAAMQARGTTEKAYVEQCKGVATASPSLSEVKPTAAKPTAAPPQQAGASSKTAKDCIAEWRADKVGMQARGVTEKAYVDQCKVGGVVPTAAAPESKPAAPAAAPAPTRTTPTAAGAAPALQTRPPATTAAPAPAPASTPSASKEGPTLEAGQFADETSAKSRCPTDTVVWVNLPSKVYHFAGGKSYGTTKRGAYMCEKDAIAGENRASKNEKRP
jgi:hypothetical protein